MQATAPVPQAPVAGPLPSQFVPEADGPIPNGLPTRTIRVDERPLEPGQQHWVAMNLGVFQPTQARVAVKVWPRPQNSVWLEAYYGSALFDVMFGFGVRVQHTAWTLSGGDRIMISPGVGLQVLPNWQVETRTTYTDPYYNYPYYNYTYSRNNLYWLVGDIDISWLHDFSPHFGFELGVKVGLAGLVGGDVGSRYPSFVMFGKGLYPIFSVYSGFRF